MYFCIVRKERKKAVTNLTTHDRQITNLKNSPAKVRKITTNLKYRKMRNQEVINNFFGGAVNGRSSNGNLRIATDSDGVRSLINYSTVLAVIENKNLTLNLTKYSTTTSRIQNCILNSLKPYNFDKITELNNIERGTQNL